MHSNRFDNERRPVLATGIPVPIVAFTFALSGDLAYTVTRNPVWLQFSFLCMGVGIFTALVTAVFGFIDLDEVAVRKRARRIALSQIVLNLGAVGIYVVNLLMRRDGAVGDAHNWPLLVGANVAALATLLIAAWLANEFAWRARVRRARRRLSQTHSNDLAPLQLDSRGILPFRRLRRS